MTDDIADRIRRAVSAATDSSMLRDETVYRGTAVAGANVDEFAKGAIDGNAFNVYSGSITESDIESMSGYESVEKIPWDGEVTVAEVDVTGGMTRALGTAMHFSLNLGNLPVILYIDTSKVVDAVHAVQYEYDWWDDHPGTLSHIETLADAEMYVNGKLYGALDGRLNEPPSLQHWGPDRVGQRATSPTYEGEKEIIAFAPKIDLDSSLRALGSIYVDAPGLSDHPRNVLNKLDGYATVPRMGGGETNISKDAMSLRDVVETLHGEVLEKSVYTPDRYFSVVLERTPTFTREDEFVTDEMFKFAFDGSTFIESAGGVPGFVLGRD